MHDLEPADSAAQTGSNAAFEAYGALARRGTSPLRQSGRSPAQAEAERLIVGDILAKLNLGSSSRLLEIGCGSGNLLIPLSFRCSAATGLDHPSVIARARARFDDPAVTWLAGAFPETPVEGVFDAILIYSVLHYLPDMRAVEAFVMAAAARLAPGGRLLLGDVPNADAKRRFMESSAGRAFDAAWRAAASAESEPAQPALQLGGDAAMIGMFTDQDVLGLVARIRQAGLHAHVLPQPPDLPFGRTREDILVTRP